MKWRPVHGLQLRAGELEYENLRVRAQEAFDREDFPAVALVADFVEANLGLIEGRPLATEYAVRMRQRNCKCASLAIYACWLASLMLTASAAVLGLEKELWPAVASATLAGVTGKVLPDWIGAYYLKPEEKRQERWQKLRAIAISTVLQASDDRR